MLAFYLLEIGNCNTKYIVKANVIRSIRVCYNTSQNGSYN